jgi:hypothetical protein
MKRLAGSKRSRDYFLICGAIFTLLLSGCGSSKPVPLFNIAGTWFVYHETNGISAEQGPDSFIFKTSDNTVSGTTSQGQSITGTVTGLDISFSWLGSDSFTYTYTGSVSSDGTTMSGTWTNTNGQSGKWHAIIDLSPAVNIAGSWNIFNTPAGSTVELGPDLFTFTQSGNGVAGLTSGAQTVIGSIGGQSIAFSWVASDGYLYIYTGSVSSDGHTMSGTWTNTNNGQSGSWRATKN